MRRRGPSWKASLGLCFGVWLLVSTWVSVGRGQDGSLEARVHALHQGAALDRHTEGALTQAERALARAREARAQGDLGAAERAEALARAALALAERRRAQQRTLRELNRAQARLAELDAALVRTREALRVERARARELRVQFEAARAQADGEGNSEPEATGEGADDAAP